MLKWTFNSNSWIVIYLTFLLSFYSKAISKPSAVVYALTVAQTWERDKL